MIKKLLERFRQDRGVHMASVRIDFFPGDQVTPHIYWHHSENPENDAVHLILCIYARILYELAELNEARVARELMAFLDQVCQRVLSNEGPPKRVRLPLGKLRLGSQLQTPPERSYQAELYQLRGGGCRLEFQGSLGKESFFLPGAFLALFQSCLDNLGDTTLERLAQVLGRLHMYYRYRRDFWEGAALNAGPTFALGKEELLPENAATEA